MLTDPSFIYYWYIYTSNNRLVNKYMGRLSVTEEQKRKGEKLAERIKASREKCKLKHTQSTLAQAAGISVDTLRKIEGGTISSPNIFLIAELAKILDVKLEEWLK